MVVFWRTSNTTATAALGLVQRLVGVMNKHRPYFVAMNGHPTDTKADRHQAAI